MPNIRVLATREKDATQRTIAVAVCLENFVVGQGGNDAEALANMMSKIVQHMGFDTLEGLPPAPEDYQKKWAASTRETQVVRGEFNIQMRSG